MLWFGKVSGIIGEFIPSGINIQKESLEVAFRKGGLKAENLKAFECLDLLTLSISGLGCYTFYFENIGNLPLTKTAK